MSERRATFDLRSLGSVTVDWGALRAAGPRPAEDPAYDLTLSGLRGRITLDAHLALQAVAATLGAPAPRLLRPLGSLERGVMAAHLVSALRAVGITASVHLTPPAGDIVGALAFEIAVGAPGGATTVRIDAPPALLPAPLSAARGDGEGRLAVDLVAEIGRTDLPAADLAAARVGDAIAFGPPVPPCVRAGRWRAPAEIHPGGVTMVGPFEADTEPSEDAGQTQILPASFSEITAELGRVTVRGGAILDLVPGRSLPIPPAVSIELRTRGRQWARGERADIDGELAVRLTHLSRH